MSHTYEYSNSYNSALSTYANLEKYNKASHFGPKLPPTVPSSNFPTILEQKPIASYDVLTHHTQHQYPDVDKAYGTSCKQKYFVGKCPSNDKIRPLNTATTMTTPAPKKCAVETEEIVEGYHDLKSLKVLLFVDTSGKCQYSEKLMHSLKKHDHFLQVIDIADPKNEQVFTNHGGYATPFFYSLATNKSVTGLVPLDKLAEMLSHHENYETPLKKKISDLDLKVFVMDMCHYCKKLKEMLESAGVKDGDVTYIKDLASHREDLKDVKGFPFTKSMKTGKVLTGCPSSIETYVKSLE